MWRFGQKTANEKLTILALTILSTVCLLYLLTVNAILFSIAIVLLIAYGCHTLERKNKERDTKLTDGVFYGSITALLIALASVFSATIG